MIKINNTEVDLFRPTYFIADIAANHDKDINRAKDLIVLAKKSGANAAKFQHFKASTIVSDKGFKDLGEQLLIRLYGVKVFLKLMKPLSYRPLGQRSYQLFRKV
jgi:sialic acid synthase SpsE